MADLVAVVKMITARIIEIYGLFDEAQTDNTLVEIHIARRFSRNGCDVMDAGHWVTSLFGLRHA